MTASDAERKNIKEKMPHLLLKRLYLNSRVSIKQLSRETEISYHTVSKHLKECIKNYELAFTTDIDTNILGFSEGRMLMIKFDKIPPTELLKEKLKDDIFVQNAYTAVGDFDLLIHVIGLTPEEYDHWEFKLRVELFDYKPRVKSVTLNHIIEGFLPIRSKIINKSKNITQEEKKILIMLIDNSRTKLTDIEKKTRISKANILYKINKLKKKGIIKQFTFTVQNPKKHMHLFYSFTFMPSKEHHPKLLYNLLDVLINNEEEDVVNDYSVVCDTTGHFDGIYFCNFKDGVEYTNRGPVFLKKIWESEYPITSECILTGIICGKWPFTTNDYTKWSIVLEHEKNLMIKQGLKNG